MNRKQSTITAASSMSTHHEWKSNNVSMDNSSEYRLKECAQTTGRKYGCYCNEDHHRRLSTWQRCDLKNSGNPRSFFFICLFGVLLLTQLTECTTECTECTKDEASLIRIDDSLGEESLSFQTFKLIKRWGNDTDILLLGGKDHVYMLDTKFSDGEGGITYRERLTWQTQPRAQNECMMMPDQPEELCENFIRLIELMENDELMVCGTNAYSPACRYYKRHQFNERIYGEDSDYRDEKKCRGQCVVPHNPKTASVSLYTNTNNGYQIFAAAVNGFMANDPIIMKYEPTLLSNSLWLNEPTFLKIMEYRDKVYVFFREKVKESESNMKEEVEYARVAQMCKNDLGGVNVLAHQWTSFLKARLRCGYSKRQHLQFNNLTSVSEIVSISKETGEEIDIFYATFSTPWDLAESSVSAVCAFSMEEVTKVFERGHFFGEEAFELRPLSGQSSESTRVVMKSYPIAEDLVPSPRPGSCNLSHSPNALYFAKEHPLMYDGVMPILFSPIYIVHGMRPTQIMVDVNAGSSRKHMVYIGTDKGKVLRLRSMLPKGKPTAVLIEILSVEAEGRCLRKDCTVRSFHISRPTEVGTESKPSLFVAFTDFVRQLPVASCSNYGTQECCSVDPDCGWNSRECVLRTSQNSGSLEPTSLDTDPLPDVCSIAGLNDRCDCKQKNTIDCEVPDETGISDEEEAEADGNLKLDALLKSSISLELRKQLKKTGREMTSNGQWKSLKNQLKEAITSTVGLVLKNHNQEYCLPSLAVNHLTHVYPLLVREIELWHETAVKKMVASEFDAKCWATDKKCLQKVSFSLPLAPMLWEPLSKLIVNFSGRCRKIGGSELADDQPKARSQCETLQGLEPCKDNRQQSCRARRCEFQEYAVDVKAFFRHANDSRHFMNRGENLEPLWKAVNVTLPSNESIQGHLEVIVSEDHVFLIDYSPVAEKVKIMFHYKPVKDCRLSDQGCADAIRACDPDVEDIVGHLHGWVKRKLPRKMKKCTRQMSKWRRHRGSSGPSHGPPAVVDHDTNTIEKATDKCRLVRGPVSFPRYFWSSIVRRAQQAGGLYTVFEDKVEFFSLQNLEHFFKNTCMSAPARQTLILEYVKGRSRRHVMPMVTPYTPFTIQWKGRFAVTYFAEEESRST